MQRLYNSDDEIDTKCDLLLSMINNALESIPFLWVEFSPNEKPWITPKLKLLNNMCYETYRADDFPKYVQFKEKVKHENKKAKLITNLKEKPHSICKK